MALGYSAFCGLFTYAEWEGYEYSIDLAFAGNNMFQSPTGRAVGIGYVVEILSRLQGHVITQPTAQINVTLDNNTSTFPLGQTLNFGKCFLFFFLFFVLLFHCFLKERAPYPPPQSSFFHKGVD